MGEGEPWCRAKPGLPSEWLPGAQAAENPPERAPPHLQVDRAGDNHRVGTPGGLCLIAEKGDVVLGDALLLEFNRHITAPFMEDVKAPV